MERVPESATRTESTSFLPVLVFRHDTLFRRSTRTPGALRGVCQSSLPPNPNLDQLEFQAKDLLKAHRSAAPRAALRLRRGLPELAGFSDAEVFQTNDPSKEMPSCATVPLIDGGWTVAQR